MTIEDLAIQGKDTNLSCAERAYNNLYKMRNKVLMNTFLRQETHHRNHLIITIKGVSFVDDSMSNSPNATWFTLYQSTVPVIWIVENLNDKDIDLSGQLSTIKDKVKGVIFVGDSNKSKKMLSQLRKITNIVETSTLSDAVELAFHLAAEGMSVVYSPASGTVEKALERSKEYNDCVYDL